MLSLTHSKIDKDATVYIASGINAWAWTIEWSSRSKKLPLISG